MTDGELHVVTGAFGYTGKYITRRLLERGMEVKTLTGHPDRPDPFDGRVAAMPFNFDRPDALAKSLEGAAVLYNTYWVRFSHGKTTFEQAVANTKTLISAAKKAGVRRMVHVSIANPSADSPLPYYSGKAELEKALMDSGLSYAILRPTVIYSLEDILINNIAWLLRHLPVFAVPGKGDYQVQPMYVEDMADLAVEAGQGSENAVIDAVGPEIFTFDEMVRLIADKIGSRAWIVHIPPGLALVLARLLSVVVRDVMLTREEMDGLTANLLVSDKAPTGTTRLSEWLAENAERVGARYASELGKHYR